MSEAILKFVSGYFSLPWWGYVVYTLVVTHITIMGVTLFLHREQTHRAIKLRPIPSHFFRFWLWLTTGMITKEWVAIHRKHHAKVETDEDPHSPQRRGIRKLLWEGAELYREGSKNPAMLERYGRGTPHDWIERSLYSRHSALGVKILMVLNIFLFGPIGLTIWAIQMVWIPLWAAGVINGVGHYRGYRNHHPEDESRNIVPWGIVIGGEELHNNHHAHITSAKFSDAPNEFDLGWAYIRILRAIGQVEVKRVHPSVIVDPTRTAGDEETIEAIYHNRFRLAHKFQSATEKYRHDRARDIEKLRVGLEALWGKRPQSKEDLSLLLSQLGVWCEDAFKSGMPELRSLAEELPKYRMKKP